MEAKVGSIFTGPGSAKTKMNSALIEQTHKFQPGYFNANVLSFNLFAVSKPTLSNPKGKGYGFRIDHC